MPSKKSGQRPKQAYMACDPADSYILSAFFGAVAFLVYQEFPLGPQLTALFSKSTQIVGREAFITIIRD